MTMHAYDIIVGDEAAPATGIPAGWAGPQGPAINPLTWPRSPRTGQPMHHRFTLWLPREYRRRGDDLVAVSVFQWHDAFYWRGPTGPGAAGPPHPHPHPHLHLADDGVDQVFALVWLTESEFAGERTTRPAPAGPPEDGEDSPDGTPPPYVTLGPIRLVARDDPYAGVAPTDFPDGDEDPDDADADDRYDRFAMEHLGGTCMSPNGPRKNLSPWYIEVNRLSGINHGGDEDIAFDLADPHVLGEMSTHVRYGPATTAG